MGRNRRVRLGDLRLLGNTAGENGGALLESAGARGHVSTGDVVTVIGIMGEREVIAGLPLASISTRLATLCGWRWAYTRLRNPPKECPTSLSGPVNARLSNQFSKVL